MVMLFMVIRRRANRTRTNSRRCNALPLFTRPRARLFAQPHGFYQGSIRSGGKSPGPARVVGAAGIATVVVMMSAVTSTAMA